MCGERGPAFMGFISYGPPRRAFVGAANNMPPFVSARQVSKSGGRTVREGVG